MKIETLTILKKGNLDESNIDFYRLGKGVYESLKDGVEEQKKVATDSIKKYKILKRKSDIKLISMKQEIEKSIQTLKRHQLLKKELTTDY